MKLQTTHRKTTQNGLLILAAMLSLSTAAFAQEEQANESTTKAGNVLPNLPEKKDGEADVDEVITNRKLRAETGSKNKFSFSTALSYSGGTVEDPAADVRPNISSSVYVPARPSLGGSVGVKYKISTLQSLSADVGLLIYRPFHEDRRQNFRERTTVADPSLTYSVIYQAAGIQNVSSIGVGVTTNSDIRDATGQTASASLSQTAIYDFGGSPWSIGLAGEIGYSVFDKGVDEIVDGSPVGYNQSDYSVALYPFAEVTLTDKLNLRTVFRPWIFEHVRAMPFGDIQRAPYTQSVGVGISVTRDIYLYPNVQFAPLNLRADRTNVGLSMNLNI